MDAGYDYDPSKDYPYQGQENSQSQNQNQNQNQPYYSEQGNYSQAAQYPQQAVQQNQQQDTKERISEIAEAIIDEKWNDLLLAVQKIIEWKEKTDQKITIIEQQLKNISENSDRVQKAVLEKVNDYNTTITDVNTELKALEKVFQKILPGFVDNVNELSRITKTMKEAKK